LNEISRKARGLSLVLSILLAIPLSIAHATTASATTDCTTVKNALLKKYNYLEFSSDDQDIIYLKTIKGLCHGGCQTMRDFKDWWRYNLPANLNWVVHDSLRTCEVVADKSDWNQPIPGKYRITKAPKVLGTPKVGKTLSFAWGSWSVNGEWRDNRWFVCKNPKSKAQSSTVEEDISISLPDSDCVQEGNPRSPDIFKLFPKHKGKFVIICQYTESFSYHGVTCSPSVRVV
jgi:hypothetical protein